MYFSILAPHFPIKWFSVVVVVVFWFVALHTDKKCLSYFTFLIISQSHFSRRTFNSHIYTFSFRCLPLKWNVFVCAREWLIILHLKIEIFFRSKIKFNQIPPMALLSFWPFCLLCYDFSIFCFQFSHTQHNRRIFSNCLLDATLSIAMLKDTKTFYFQNESDASLSCDGVVDDHDDVHCVKHSVKWPNHTEKSIQIDLQIGKIKSNVKSVVKHLNLLITKVFLLKMIALNKTFNT